MKCDIIPLLSPCSPMMYPWQFWGATRKRSLIRKRKREESSIVPLPITRCIGKPLSFHATYVITSTVTQWHFTALHLAPLSSISQLLFRWSRVSQFPLFSPGLSSFTFSRRESLEMRDTGFTDQMPFQPAINSVKATKAMQNADSNHWTGHIIIQLSDS